MYSLRDYGVMLADSVRMDPYAYALKNVVGPNSVVLDIGTATGIHALLAAKFGARKVFAVESNEAIHLARALAAANGYADRIEFIQAASTEITLPERADIIVSDLRGTLPLFADHVPSIIDARRRHLAPGGCLIPARDKLYVALVEAHSVYRDLVRPWDYPYGLNMEIAKDLVLNSWSDDNSGEIHSRNLLIGPQLWATLDFSTIINPSVGQFGLKAKVMRAGTAHGLLVWFDAKVGEGIGFSNGPQQKQIAEVYGRGFFPLLKPVRVAEGNTVIIDIHATYSDGGYEWQWNTQIVDNHNPDLKLADFKQSTIG